MSSARPPEHKVRAVMRELGCDFYAACRELGRRGARARARKLKGRAYASNVPDERLAQYQASRPDLYN